MKLAIGLVVKDGKELIDKWIESADRIADVIFVIDNGADQDVKDKLITHPKVKHYLIQKDMGRNQSRDYQKILEMAREEDCTWIWNIDIDEIVPKIDIMQLKQTLLNTSADSIGFPLFEMRNDDKHYVMINDIDGTLKDARLSHKCYKVLSHFAYNQKDKHGTPIPHNCKPGKMFFAPIKHYGHFNETLRNKKKKQYIENNFKDKSELNATWMENDDSKVEIREFNKFIEREKNERT